MEVACRSHLPPMVAAVPLLSSGPFLALSKRQSGPFRVCPKAITQAQRTLKKASDTRISCTHNSLPTKTASRLDSCEECGLIEKECDCESNQTFPHGTARRSLLMLMSLAGLELSFGSQLSGGKGQIRPDWLFCAPANAFEAAKIDFSTQPSSVFDPTDTRLREAAVIFQQALDATTVEEEERLWTEVIEKCSPVEAEWVNDILSRAWGNRGNARSRQGRMEEALDDYSRSIELAPYAIDPVLNRGVALESLGRFQEAARDYLAVLEAVPADPAAWNNLGNVSAALGQWDEALADYKRAKLLSPEFSFAAANYALALYQVGRSNEAIKQFRTLLRRYPEFPDMRAALAVSLYKEGLTGEAETNWIRLEDQRYRDRTWVRNTRRWPPRLADALEAFLDVKPSS